MLKWIRRWAIFIGLLIAGLAALYLLGPRPEPFDPGSVPPAPVPDLEMLEQAIRDQENTVRGLKPDNEARIHWANPEAPARTEYSLVYLHGFGASQAEARPVHEEVARAFGMNLFLARLHEHGIERADGFANLTAASYLRSAREALAVGKALGKQVVLMGTSTGASLALFLAAGDPDVAALLLFSPLIDSADGLLFLPRGPWGEWLVKRVQGNPRIVERDPPISAYWSRVYDAAAYVALSQLIGQTMHAQTYARVHCPVFLGYYFKNENEQDDTVSVPAMRDMFRQLGTSPDHKKEQAFPESRAHVIAADLVSENWESVRDACSRFLADTLGLEPEVTGNSHNRP